MFATHVCRVRVKHLGVSEQQCHSLVLGASSGGTITRVSCNLTFSQRNKRLSLQVFCLFPYSFYCRIACNRHIPYANHLTLVMRDTALAAGTPVVARCMSTLFQGRPSYGSGRYGSPQQMLCGEASRVLLIKSLSTWAVFWGLTESCSGIWNPGPQTPPIINNKNDHLALLDS